MATSLETSAIVVMRVHCTGIVPVQESVPYELVPLHCFSVIALLVMLCIVWTDRSTGKGFCIALNYTTTSF